MPPKTTKTPDTAEPKKKAIYTITLNAEQMQKLQTWLDAHTWAFYEVEYAAFAFKGNQVNVVGYKSGKVVIQGKKTEDFVTYVLEAEITGTPKLGYEEVNNPEWFEAHGGLDESGKGDFFGPMISACVIADGDMVRVWRAAGIQDSKRITSDKAIFDLEKQIRATQGVVVKLTWAGMVKYNELYHKFNDNTNKLLAWMHAKALEDALKVRRVEWAMLDQFTDKPLVQNYFKNDPVQVRMMTKAESDPVVAAASICARAEFVRQMDKLSVQYGEKLLRGASAQVKEQGRELVRKLGAEALGSYAKTHFRTAYEILGLPVPEKFVWKTKDKKKEDEFI